MFLCFMFWRLSSGCLLWLCNWDRSSVHVCMRLFVRLFGFFEPLFYWPFVFRHFRNLAFCPGAISCLTLWVANVHAHCVERRRVIFWIIFKFSYLCAFLFLDLAYSTRTEDAERVCWLMGHGSMGYFFIIILTYSGLSFSLSLIFSSYTFMIHGELLTNAFDRVPSLTFSFLSLKNSIFSSSFFLFNFLTKWANVHLRSRWMLPSFDLVPFWLISLFFMTVHAP